MKSTSILSAIFLALFSLAGCATSDSEQHSQHHPNAASAQEETMPSAGGKMGMMDLKTMCEMHTKMMDAKTSDERQAMMTGKLGPMSPEMMKKQMQMMDQKCK